MQALKSSRLGGLAVACLLVLGGSPLGAQTPRGAVEGRVVTDIGEPLAAAEIILTPSEGHEVRRTETDRSGSFRIGFLADGQYVLTVRRIGYRSAEPLLVSVQGGEPVRLTVPMEPVAVAIDSLVTSAPRVSITRTDTEFGTRLTARELAILPTFNDARLLVAFTPGARPDQIWGAASAQANQYQLDGITVNHPGVGGDFVQPSVTWIQDLEVRGLGAGAETGNFQGGIVNYLTKSGGNSFEGQARLSFESYQVNGSNLGLAEVGSELGGRFDFDGQVRGPIVRDKLHFALFGQFIKRDLRVQNQVPQVPSELVDPAPDYSELKVLGKLTWRPGARDLVTGSVTRFGLEGDPAENDGFMSPEAAQKQSFGTWLYSANWRRTWSEKSDIDLRLGGYRSNEDLVPYQGGSVPGLLTQQELDPLGYQNAAFTEKKQPSSFDALVTWSIRGHALGASHDLKVGAEYQAGGWDYSRIRNGGLTWRPFDRRIPPFWDPAVPSTWVSQGMITSTWGGEVELRSNVENSAVFIQDYMELGPRLRLNPGVRLGRWVGKLTPTSGDQFTAVKDVALDPRVGVVFDIDGKGGFVAKAHWGRYHQGMFAAFFDRVQGADVFNDEQRWGYKGTPFSDPRTTFTAAERDQLAAQGLFELLQTISLSETGPVENYKQPYVDQAILGLEKTFGDSWKATALYVNRRNKNMVALVDKNAASNWTEFSNIHMLDRFSLPIQFGGQPLIMDKLWISNRDMMYWWQLFKAGDVQGPTYIPPGMSASELDALTYDPDYVLTTVPDARREFDQLQLTVEARYPKWWTSASATISRLEGNFNAVTGPDDYTTGGAGPWVRPNEQINSFGHLSNQSRFEFKAQLGGLLPWGFRGGAFLTFFEGDRVTPTLTVNSLLLEMGVEQTGGVIPCVPAGTNPGLCSFKGFFLDGANGHRIFVQPRGTYRYPSRTSMDLHLERSFQSRGGELLAQVDAFNVFGSDAVTSIQTSVNGLFDAFTGASEYGKVRGRVPPRTLRFGAAWRF